MSCLGPASVHADAVADMIELTRQYGRYGYCRIAALLRDAGWQVNDKRVERLWRREGLKVPMKQPKKGRLWLNDGSYVRLRPEHRDHVWSYDFVHHWTDDGKAFLDMLSVFAEFETNLRKERQAKRIPKARASGKYTSRKATTDADAIKELADTGLDATAIARQMGINRATFYRALT